MKYGMRLWLMFKTKKERNDLIDLIKDYMKEHKPVKKKFQRWDIEETKKYRSLGEEEIE